MSRRTRRFQWIYILSLSAVSALIVGSLIRTALIGIAFSILAFLLTLILLLILSSGAKPMFSLRMGERRFPPSAFLYTAGLIASVFIIILPNANMIVDPNSMWNSFVSLSVASLIRMFAGFFLTCIFPGEVIYSTFLRELRLNLLERIGLILLLSYCFTMTSGLALLALGTYSVLSFTAILWVLVTVLEAYRHFKAKEGYMLEHRVFSFDMNSAAQLLAAGALIGFSYLQVFGVPPFMGILSGDIQDYFVAANRFIYCDVYGWSPYVWGNVFFWFVASLAGVPMLYAYAGLQFYQIVLASSFYFFVRTLLPKRKEIASVATLLCFFGAGLASWLMLYLMMTSQTVFQQYTAGNAESALTLLFQYTGGSGLTPFSLSVFCFDFGLVFYALAFIHRGLLAGKPKLTDYLLPSFLCSVAFLTHNVALVLLPVFVVAFSALLLARPRRYLLKILILMAVFTIALDPLSRWFSSNWLIDRMGKLSLQTMVMGPGAAALLLVVSVATVSTALLLFVFYKKKGNPPLGSKITHALQRMLSGNHMKTLFYVLGFTVLFVSVALYFQDYENIQYLGTGGIQPYIYPLYYIVFRVYGIVLPFAVASIPYLLNMKKGAVISILTLLLSSLTVVVLSLLLPVVLNPNIGYVRYSAYLLYPFSILAAFTLVSSLRAAKRRKNSPTNEESATGSKGLQAFALLSLAILISSPILSQAYIRELYLLPGQSRPSEAGLQAIDWINANIPSGSSVLPLTLGSEKLLSSLASGIHVIPEFQMWWLRDVLMRSRPDIVHYSLVRTGIDYIFTTDEELSELRSGFQGSYFKFTILSFPEVYNNDQIVIFKVPELPLYKDSNIILVNPSSSDNEPGIENAFRLLITSKTRFSVVDDSSLLALKPGSVYLFAGGESLPMASRDILENIKQGASVVSFDSKSIYQILNVTYPGENWTIPTSSLTGWDIESSSVTLDIGRDNTLASTLLVEGNSGDGGDFVLRYTPSSSLDIREISFIELWLKTSVSGNFYFGLLNNLQTGEVWWGHYDTRYKIEIRDTGEWMRVVLPMSEPTFLTPSFNLSKVNLVRIGMDGLDLNQSFTFSVGGIRALRGIGEIDFADWAAIPDDGLAIYKTHSPPLEEVIANCSLKSGSTVPYIMRARIGNGSLYFVDTISPIDIQHQEEYNTLLNHTGLLLQDLFNATALPEQKMLFPLPDHLFRQVWFYPLDFAFTLSDLYGLLFWQSDMSLSGDLEIQSSRIYLANEHLTTEEVRICSDQGNLTLQDATLYNPTFVGEGKILASSSITAVVNSYAGLYSMMRIDDSGQCQMSLWDANASFQLNIGGNIQNISAAHVTVSLLFNHSGFSIRAKQPTIKVNGHARGMAQGILTYDFYATSQQIRDFSGELEFTVLYCSNIIYSKLI